MIKNITSSSRWLYVSGGSTSGPYISPGSSGAGMLRYNPNTQDMEVNDGNSWLTIPSGYASVEMSPEAESLLNWAQRKRDEEERLEAMMEKYPTLKKAKENFDIVLNLVKDDFHEM